MDSANNHNSEDSGSARTKIITVARRLFAEHGLAGTSTRDIAGEAGLNISLISYYFGGKEGLYKAVIEEFALQASGRMNLLFDSLDLENLDREKFLKTMHGLLSGMIPMKFSEPDINTILQREMMAGMPHAKEIFNSTFVGILERIVALYQRGQKKGFVRKDVNPYVVFLSLVHASDAFANVRQCQTKISDKVPQIPRDTDEYIDQIFKIFVEGVMI
jgi:AcrR family transcriptional regulator